MCECGSREVKQDVYMGMILFRCAECNAYQKGGEYNE